VWCDGIDCAVTVQTIPDMSGEVATKREVERKRRAERIERIRPLADSLRSAQREEELAADRAGDDPPK
jgi:hypothetical protein